MTNPAAREDIPYDREGVAAMVQRLYALKEQRMAVAAAAQTAGERSSPAPPVSTAPPTTTTAARKGDVPRQRRRAIPAAPVVPHPGEEQLGLFDV